MTASGCQPFDATLGLGSNVGDKAANIEEAISRLAHDASIKVVGRSKLYRSAPWGVVDQDWFLNACISIATDLDPHSLLHKCQTVEHEMGRVRQQRWGPRLIDVDILTYRDEVLSDVDLVIPHPMITKRSFVLVPLRDIAPDLTIERRSLDAWIADIGTSDLFELKA